MGLLIMPAYRAVTTLHNGDGRGGMADSAWPQEELGLVVLLFFFIVVAIIIIGPGSFD